MEQLADELDKEYKIESEILVAALSNPSENNRIMNHIFTLKDLDVLINNAGFGLMKDFSEAKTESHVDMIR